MIRGHDDKRWIIVRLTGGKAGSADRGSSVPCNGFKQDLPVQAGLSQGFCHQKTMVFIADGDHISNAANGLGTFKCQVKQMPAIHQWGELLGRQLA
jgi:hypothetical protein